MYRIAEYRYGNVRIGIHIESKIPVYDTYRKPVRSPTDNVNKTFIEKENNLTNLQNFNLELAIC